MRAGAISGAVDAILGAMSALKGVVDAQAACAAALGALVCGRGPKALSWASRVRAGTRLRPRLTPQTLQLARFPGCHPQLCVERAGANSASEVLLDAAITPHRIAELALNAGALTVSDTAPIGPF